MCQKLIGPDIAYTNNGDGTITVLKYGVSCNQILKQLCPNLKVGDTIVVNAISKGMQFIYLTKSKTTIKFRDSHTITQDDLDSYVAFYTDGKVPVTISNIQIEDGSICTDYEP